MKITTNKTAGPGDKVTSTRHYKDIAEQKKQESAEGKDTPFQKALREAEGKNRKVFHWHDKKKQASDTPFEGSRPIATRSTGTTPIPHTPVPEKKIVIPDVETKTKVDGTPKIKITAKETTITPKFDQQHKGKRAHGTVKNTMLRKIDAVINPGKYGAPSNNGKNININRSTTHTSSPMKPSGYTITPAGDKDKSFTVKKLKPKHVLKAAREKGLIQ